MPNELRTLRADNEAKIILLTGGPAYGAEVAAQILGRLDQQGVLDFVGHLSAGTALHLGDLLASSPAAESEADQ